MTNKHLSDEELIAIVDDTARSVRPVNAHPHLQACMSCRRRLTEFETTLALASQLSQPTDNLQDEAFVQATSQRLWSRRSGLPAQRATSAWRPAMAGALVTGAVAASLALLLVPHSEPQSLTPVAASVQAPAAATDTTGATADAEQELATMLDTYLFETASTDELLLELDALSDDDYYALLED